MWKFTLHRVLQAEGTSGGSLHPCKEHGDHMGRKEKQYTAKTQPGRDSVIHGEVGGLQQQGHAGPAGHKSSSSIGNKHMDTKGEGENWEVGIDMHTLLILCIK